MSRQGPEDKGQTSSPKEMLMRNKLAADIKKFEQQLADLKNNGSYTNFADILTLKELIRSRQEMLDHLQEPSDFSIYPKR